MFKLYWPWTMIKLYWLWAMFKMYWLWAMFKLCRLNLHCLMYVPYLPHTAQYKYNLHV